MITRRLRFRDLQERGIVTNRVTLRNWIIDRAFPRGTTDRPQFARVVRGTRSRLGSPTARSRLKPHRRRWAAADGRARSATRTPRARINPHGRCPLVRFGGRRLWDGLPAVKTYLALPGEHGDRHPRIVPGSTQGGIHARSERPAARPEQPHSAQQAPTGPARAVAVASRRMKASPHGGAFRAYRSPWAPGRATGYPYGPAA